MISYLMSLFKTSITSAPDDQTHSPLPRSQSSYRSLPSRATTIAAIDINDLLQANIRGIILDLDNTIVSEDDRYLCPYAEEWIKEAKAKGLKFYILSNGKRRYRVRYWSARLDIPAVNPARKPFPPAFRQALSHMQLKAKQVVVIGDSLHTDVIGAAWSGCAVCIQVATLPHPPRWWETILGWYVQRPFPRELELWDFHPSAYQEADPTGK